MNKDYIKIPTDFNDLTNLKELNKHYDTITAIKTSLDNFQREYFKSQLKTYHELLEYIREDDIKNYKINMSVNNTTYYYYSVGEYEEQDKKKITKKYTHENLIKIIDDIFIGTLSNQERADIHNNRIDISEKRTEELKKNKNKKLFLVNFKDKEIDLFFAYENINYWGYKFDGYNVTTCCNNIIVTSSGVLTIRDYYEKRDKIIGHVNETFYFSLDENRYTGYKIPLKYTY